MHVMISFEASASRRVAFVGGLVTAAAAIGAFGTDAHLELEREVKEAVRLALVLL